MIGIGQEGYIALNFIREADTAEDAVTSALEDVRCVLPNSPLIEAAPDLGGISDIAELLDVSRQHARRLITLNNTCPPPLHFGKSPIWHMSEVLSHLSVSYSCKGLTPDIISLTQINQIINSLKDMQRVRQDLLLEEQGKGRSAKLDRLVNV